MTTYICKFQMLKHANSCTDTEALRTHMLYSISAMSLQISVTIASLSVSLTSTSSYQLIVSYLLVTETTDHFVSQASHVSLLVCSSASNSQCDGESFTFEVVRARLIFTTQSNILP